MRKALSLGVISSVLLGLLGLYLFFTAAIMWAKIEAEQKLAQVPAASLEQFRFSEQAFAALPRPEGNDDELVIEGVLYDIKEVVHQQGSVLVYGFNDSKESRLLGKLAGWLNNESASDKSSNPTAVILFLPECIMARSEFVFIDQITFSPIPFMPSRLVTGIRSVISPPPDNRS